MRELERQRAGYRADCRRDSELAVQHAVDMAGQAATQVTNTDLTRAPLHCRP